MVSRGCVEASKYSYTTRNYVHHWPPQHAGAGCGIICFNDAPCLRVVAIFIAL
nr:MAG TPA: hypothetical protein [Caudoviricetes sp.]